MPKYEPNVAGKRKTGRPAGRPQRSPSEKANMLVAKTMAHTNGKTMSDIAIEFGTGIETVYDTRLNSVDAETRKIYKKKMARLEDLALATTEAALIKGKELIEQADNPRHLSGIAAVGKMSDTVYRLETGKPTEITNVMPAETHALEFIRMMMEKMDRQSALDAFLRAPLDPLVPEVRKLEIKSRIESGDLKLLT